VIGGYDPSASNFESFLVSFHEKRELYFAARIKAGFTPQTRAEVFRRISGLEIRMCPFANLPNSTGRSHWGDGVTAEDMKKFQWVKPKVVVEVAFGEWTEGGLLRHPQFVGVRDDKVPTKSCKVDRAAFTRSLARSV
jgi:bifunctional non-homologous end joining protein LigD